MVTILAVILGFMLGTLYKGGLNINITRKQPETEVSYNESMIDELDPEIRQYYDNNNGLNKF